MKRKYVPGVSCCKNLGAFCLTEQSSGSDAASLKSEGSGSKRKDGQYRINGSKVFITNGGEADVSHCFCLDRPSRREAKGISAFVVEKGTPGLIIGKDERKNGPSASSTVQVYVRGYESPRSQSPRRRREGFKIVMANLDAGRIGIAAQALGIAEGAMEHAVRICKSRSHFGNLSQNSKGLVSTG